jgi:branched-chain amino acid transport system ATP-binding protein
VNLICGRVVPTAGRIVFAGEDITGLPAHRRVGRGIAYTFQITSVFGNLSTFDNVALAVQNGMQRGAPAWRFARPGRACAAGGRCARAGRIG